MEVIMKSLRTPGRDGVELTGGDGAVRKCFTILACYVADYPEQCLVACTRFGSRCPRCKATANEFEDHNLPWMPREQGATLRTLRRAAKLATATKRESILKDYGLTHVDAPFWADHHLSDIHKAITPDVLHQLYQGVLEHLISWLSSVMGPAELDARFKRLPETHGVRSFAKGISGLVRVSGGEHKEISLDAFHADKQVFLNLDARIGGHFNIPKLHNLQHYIDCIRDFGTTDNSNTEATERLHIDFAKDAYRATNKKDYVEQMIWWLERHDKVAMFDVHVRWLLGELPSTKPAQRPLPRTISIAKKPNSARIPFTILSRSHHAPDFPSALQQYIGSISKTAERPRRRGQRSFEDLVLPFKVVDVWHRIKFSLPNLQLDTSPSFNNTVIAQPSSSTASERFNTVLVDERGEAGDAGVAGLRESSWAIAANWYARIH
ncbi:hypothetical protein FA95DRAFT_1613456 [Auriscalpium vulgare]|uniref:Uncharacterized protein n=1 Tax=Auriscalpium vulgare TaxID=40419 RepID=A0ACB8R2L8_9AGAM|nr:hypothetical protein FA95DRAFT_1613456 [Auriscalpium vulgare]